MGTLLVASEHFGETPAAGAAVEGLGLKALSLLRMAPDWTPPFLAIDAAAHDTWLGQLHAHDPVTAARLVLAQFDRNELNRAFSTFPEFTRMLVRSSGTDETLSDRGVYRSEACARSFEALAEAMARIWLHAKSCGNARLGLVIHLAVDAKRSGHLSNERRVARERNRWTLEYAESDGEPQVTQFSVVGVQPAGSARLDCSTPVELDVRLRAVAAAQAVGTTTRLHIEWVWDGRRLWLVQSDADDAESRDSHEPGDCWKVFAEDNSVTTERPERELNLAVLVVAREAATKWKKTACLRDFHEVDLSAPLVYVLEDAEVLAMLQRGVVSEHLEADIATLTTFPVVVRSDRCSGDGAFQSLSARSGVLSTRDAVLAFLKTASAVQRQAGLTANSVCFLLHHAVPSYAGAFSFARPEMRRVRVDATWGTPDSLLYYAHDSFEIDVDTGQDERRVRGKTRFADVLPDGEWGDVWCRPPFDWKPSLTDSQIASIAESTLALAVHLGRPVKIMWLVSGPQQTDVLPWVYLDEDLPRLATDSASPLGVAATRVSSMEDLRIAEERLAGAGRGRIRVAPSVALIRSEEFVSELAEVALRCDVPVEIEGSVLSHAFYYLDRRGVRVRPVQPHTSSRDSRRFDKLVRDRVPDKIAARGERAHVHSAHGDMLAEMLRAKAVEEALELRDTTDPAQTLEEMADVLEVLRALASAVGLSLDDVLRAADEKRSLRGGFDTGTVLVGTDRTPLAPASAEGLLLELEGDGADASTLVSPFARPDIEPLMIPEAVGLRSLLLPLVPPSAVARKSVHTLVLAGRKYQVAVVYKDKTIEVSVSLEDDGPQQATLDGTIG